MSSPIITLTVSQGRLEGKEYTFDERGCCIIGRAEDCDVRLPLDLEHANISRRHCLLEIDPPGVRIRDLGRRNGTFVNGEKIGQRSADNGNPEASAAYELHDGDSVRVGHTVFQVHIAAANEPSVPMAVPMYFV